MDQDSDYLIHGSLIDRRAAPSPVAALQCITFLWGIYHAAKSEPSHDELISRDPDSIPITSANAAQSLTSRFPKIIEKIVSQEETSYPDMHHIMHARASCLDMHHIMPEHQSG